MEFKYIDEKDSRGLLNNMFIITYKNENLPFKSKIIPTGFPSVTYIFGEKQKAIHKDKSVNFNELIISGQFNSTYSYHVNSVAKNIGFNLYPTALYKILGTNISVFKNKLINFKKINKELSEKFTVIFLKNEHNHINLINESKNLINNLDLYIDRDVEKIDLAIEYILEKEGMLQVIDLLKIVALSQKSLETKFKRIIGLTPGKYIRLTRFIKLMRRYECKEIEINDLIYMYNYYDHSHFIKDFKLFMSESPKEYFKKEYPLIKAYSKDL